MSLGLTARSCGCAKSLQALTKLNRTTNFKSSLPALRRGKELCVRCEREKIERFSTSQIFMHLYYTVTALSDMNWTHLAVEIPIFGQFYSHESCLCTIILGSTIVNLYKFEGHHLAKNRYSNKITNLNSIDRVKWTLCQSNINLLSLI